MSRLAHPAAPRSRRGERPDHRTLAPRCRRRRSTEATVTPLSRRRDGAVTPRRYLHACEQLGGDQPEQLAAAAGELAPALDVEPDGGHGAGGELKRAAADEPRGSLRPGGLVAGGEGDLDRAR